MNRIFLVVLLAIIGRIDPAIPSPLAEFQWAAAPGAESDTENGMKKEGDMVDGGAIYEATRRFLNRYKIDKYDVKFNDCPLSHADAAELMTLLRARSWQPEDEKKYGSYYEPYATLCIKAEGGPAELQLSINDHGIKIYYWTPLGYNIMAGGASDQYGNYSDWAMYEELLPKINEMLYRTVADFGHAEIVDTLRVVVTRTDYDGGGQSERVTMSDGDSAEYLRLFNHARRSVSHFGGQPLYQAPSGVAYTFSYGEQELCHIRDYVQASHKSVSYVFSEEDSKAIALLEEKYVDLLGGADRGARSSEHGDY